MGELISNAVYGAPGVNGDKNSDVCYIPDSPMLQVLICAPPIAATSPAPIVMPTRFCKLFISLSYGTPHIIFFERQGNRFFPTPSQQGKLPKRIRQVPLPHASERVENFNTPVIMFSYFGQGNSQMIATKKRPKLSGAACRRAGHFLS